MRRLFASILLVAAGCSSAATSPPAATSRPPEPADEPEQPAVPAPGTPSRTSHDSAVAAPSEAAPPTAAADAAPVSADASAAPPAAPPGGSAPSALKNLVLWLDAGKDVTTAGDKVSRWGDQSPAHNHAAQASAAKQPTLVAAIANGRPALRFLKQQLLIADSPSLDWGTGDFTVAMVARYRNKPGIHLDGWAMFFHKKASKAVDGRPEPAEVILAGNWPNGETTPEVTKLTLSLNAHMVKAMTSDQGYDDDVFRVITGVRVAGKIVIRVNGVVKGSGGGGWNVDSAGLAASIGASTGGGFAMDGDIAEVVALAGPTSDADLRALEAYLAAKYGVR